MALPAGRYGVTKNQLLKIKKLPMNTIKLIEELTEKFDLLGSAAFKNSTSVVTDSSDLVESGAVCRAIGIDFKNILPNDAISQTINGVTFTVNEDGSVTVNGTATANTFFKIFEDNNHTVSWNGYKLTGCPSGGGNSTYRLDLSNVDVTSESDVGDGKEISVDTTGKIIIRIRIGSGYTANNLVFYPMISKEGGAYEPYHASVSDSLDDKCDNSVIGTVEGANASKAWSVGEHFIKDGAFKEVTQPIASGGDINSSNTVDKPIADCLPKQATFSGTTGSDGNLKIVNDVSMHIIGVNAQGAIFIPFQTSTDTYIKVTNYDLSPKTNTLVNGTYYYI